MLVYIQATSFTSEKLLPLQNSSQGPLSVDQPKKEPCVFLAKLSVVLFSLGRQQTFLYLPTMNFRDQVNQPFK